MKYREIIANLCCKAKETERAIKNMHSSNGCVCEFGFNNGRCGELTCARHFTKQCKEIIDSKRIRKSYVDEVRCKYEVVV